MTDLRALLGASALALVLAACGGGEEPTTDTVDPPLPAGTEAASEPGEVTEAAAMADETGAPAVALYAFDCGVVQVSDLAVFSSDGEYEGMTDTFGNTCYLIRHPEGDLLWDLGLPGALAGGEPMVNGVFTVSLERSLTDQLAEIDVAPADIDYVAISHYHFDHTGQPDAAGEATWLVHETEYESMFGENKTADGEYPALAALERQTFTGEFDVFGDGTVTIIETPGHTPGHTSLLLRLDETGPVLLTGDLYHREQSREEKIVPSFNTSAEETLASMDAFEELAAGLGAQVIIQHSADDYAALPKPPEALR